MWPIARLIVAASLLATAAAETSAEPLQPPQYTMATWTARDGLPSSYVISLAQDREGYLWVGTSAGLARFDGQRFVKWPRNQDLPSPNPLVHAIAPGRDGVLWIAFGGLSRIARDRGGRVTTYTTRDGLPDGGMYTVIERRDGSVWAGGRGGLARFRDERWERVRAPFDGRDRAVMTLTEDSAGHLWAITPDDLYVRGDSTDAFTRVSTGLTGTVRFSESGGRAVVTGDARVATMNLDRTGAQVLPIAPGPLTGPFPTLRDRAGHIWAGTNGEGLFRVDEQPSGPAPHFTERNGLGGDQIRALLEDRDGNLWVGSQAGLTRMTESKIASVTTRADVTSENISTLAADALGNVWVQAPGRLVRIAGRERTPLTTAAGARLDVITALFADPHGRTWIASAGGRLTTYENGTFHPVARDDGSTRSIVGIAAARDGAVWLYDGGHFVKRGPAESDRAIVEGPPQLRVNQYRFLHVDARGQLWAGADGGLVGVYDGASFRLYGAAEGVPEGQLSGILEDARGRIWIASDRGLSAFERGRFVTVTRRNGLPGDRVFFAIEDGAGFLWLGVDNGIVRIALEELDHAVADASYHVRYRLFDESDGLRGTPVLRGLPNASRAPDGSIWFVTTTGIAVIAPQRLAAGPPPPRAHVDTIMVDGRPATAAAGFQLPPRVSSLQLEYSALNLTSPSKVRFRHRLEGVDANWVDDGANRQTVYANLAPGPYRFQIAASNGDDAGSAQPDVWAFTVLPAWYQTRTFYAAFAAAALLSIWTVWQLRVRKIRRQFSVVLAERARVGREIHDTLLQSLVGMALDLDNLATQIDDPAVAMSDELSRMRKRVEHYIEEAQQSISELRAPRLSALDLPSLLRERGERITENAGVRFSFAASGTPHKVASRVEEQVLRIAQEAVVNAVRHGQPREVRMELAYEDRALRLRVADDGCGFDPESVNRVNGGHWGMSIMRERAEQIGGSLTISSAPDGGTRIDVVAPAGA